MIRRLPSGNFSVTLGRRYAVEPTYETATARLREFEELLLQEAREYAAPVLANLAKK